MMLKPSFEKIKSLVKTAFSIASFKQENFYSKQINKNELCFDIGANIGTKSKPYLSLKANVIAFDPQNSCQSFLKKIKKKYSNFKFYKLAVGNSNEEKELAIGSHIEIITFSKEFKHYFKTDTPYRNSKEKVTVAKLMLKVINW